jgi:hypothetical protein
MKADTLLLRVAVIGAWFCGAWLCQGQTAELTPAWNMRKALDDLVSQSQRLAPMLEEIKPAEWTGKGAPETYIDQHKSVLAEMGYLKRTAEDLARQPESLPTALQLYFRLQALEAMLDSLSQGVRRYQDPALANLMQTTISDNDSHRVRLGEYLMELATTKEAEFRAADSEAQRCRVELIRQPRTGKKQ